MREYITGYHIANGIRQMRSHYKEAFVIVEGEASDLKLFSNFFADDICQLVPAHGKENALQAHRILFEDNFQGWLTIVDADFWRIEKQEIPFTGLFCPDTHDLETMMFKSPALDKLLVELGSQEKIIKFREKTGKGVRDLLTESAYNVGCLRFVSYLNNFNLKFEDVTYSKFIDSATLVCDIKLLVKTIKNKTQSNLADSLLLEYLVATIENKHDYWEICCGHDLTQILSISLRKLWGTNDTKEIEPTLLERELRLAYEFQFFMETELFKSLKKWEQENKPYKIFK